MSILPKAIYRFSAIPIKIPMAFFTELEQIILKFVMETLQTPNTQNNLEKEEQSWRYHAPWLQTVLQSYSHQNSMVLAQKQTHRSMEQNREPRNKPTLNGQLIYNKGGKNIQWRKDSLFNKWCWESWTATCKRMKLQHFLIPYKNKLKMD